MSLAKICMLLKTDDNFRGEFENDPIEALSSRGYAVSFEELQFLKKNVLAVGASEIALSDLVLKARGWN